MKSTISYNVVAGNLKTAVTKAEFDKALSFKSFAYFLDDGMSWDTNKNAAIPYIDGLSVSYDGNSESWHGDNTYYWPGKGSLTFFAFSPATLNATIDQTSGIGIKGWDVSANPATDIMIADVVKDKTAEDTAYGLNGVPTIFRHKLAKMTFKANINSDPGDGSYVDVESITMTDVYTVGDYAEGTWQNLSSLKDITFVPDGGSSRLTATATGIGEPAMILPQTLYTDSYRTSAPMIVVKYIINGTETEKSFRINTLADQWLINQNITYTIIFSLKEEYITFDTSVEDWTYTDGSSINIGQ
jgi:hypothetical protein